MTRKSILVDDYRTSDDYKQNLVRQASEKEQRLALYAARYDQGLGIFNGESLPAEDRILSGEP